MTYDDGRDIAADPSHQGMGYGRALHDAWLWDGQSSAHAVYSPEYKQSTVEQRGPRDLWNETEAAYLEWIKWGGPSRDRFEMTVTPNGQQIWIDTPDRVLAVISRV